MNVAVIQYDGGNTQSVLFALERAGVAATVTNEPVEIIQADKVIFPGVGEAATAMRYLQENSLDKVLRSLTTPVLGICLGMQLLCRHTEEGDVPCLGVFDTNVKRFRNGKVPHMGWNTIEGDGSPLLKGLANDTYLYFVHSYYAEECNSTVATTEYSRRFSSVLQKDNFFGVQFHPEKSAGAGATIIRNFLDL